MLYAVKCDSMDDVMKVVSIHDSSCHIPHKDHMESILNEQWVIRVISQLGVWSHGWTYWPYIYNERGSLFVGRPLSVEEFLSL